MDSKLSIQLALPQKLTDATMQRPQFIALGGGGEEGIPGWTGSGTPFAEGRIGHEPRTTKSGNGGDGARAENSEGGLTDDSRVADNSSRGSPEGVDVAEEPKGTLLEASEQRILLRYGTSRTPFLSL